MNRAKQQTSPLARDRKAVLMEPQAINGVTPTSPRPCADPPTPGRSETRGRLHQEGSRGHRTLMRPMRGPMRAQAGTW
eukprot:4142850-Alexandrium_andersonii.AAC.1